MVRRLSTSCFANISASRFALHQICLKLICLDPHKSSISLMIFTIFHGANNESFIHLIIFLEASSAGQKNVQQNLTASQNALESYMPIGSENDAYHMPLSSCRIKPNPCHCQSRFPLATPSTLNFQVSCGGNVHSSITVLNVSPNHYLSNYA